MKKGWKIFWIVAAVMAATGMICLIAAVAMGASLTDLRSTYPNGIGIVKSDWDEGSFDHHEAGNGSLGTFEDVQEMEIDIKYGGLKILSHSKPYIAVETEGGGSRWKVETHWNNGKLYIDTTENSWRNSHRVGTVYVYIPEKMEFNQVNVDMGTGQMEAENIKTRDLVVNVGAGEARIEKFTVRDLDMKCGAGSIVAAGTLDGDASIDGGVGRADLTVAGSQEDFNYDINVGIGEVKVGNNRYSGIDSGRYLDSGSDKTIDIDCGIGAVYVSFQ